MTDGASELPQGRPPLIDVAAESDLSGDRASKAGQSPTYSPVDERKQLSTSPSSPSSPLASSNGVSLIHSATVPRSRRSTAPSASSAFHSPPLGQNSRSIAGSSTTASAPTSPPVTSPPQSTRRPPPLFASSSFPSSSSFSLSSPTIPTLPSSRPVLISPTSPSLSSKFGGRRRHAGSLPLMERRGRDDGLRAGEEMMEEERKAPHAPQLSQSQQPTVFVIRTASGARASSVQDDPSIASTSSSPLSSSLMSRLPSDSFDMQRASSVSSAALPPRHRSSTVTSPLHNATSHTLSQTTLRPHTVPSLQAPPVAAFNYAKTQPVSSIASSSQPTSAQHADAATPQPTLVTAASSLVSPTLAVTPAMPPFTISNEQQHALLTTLTTTPLLSPSAFPTITAHQLSLVLVASSLSVTAAVRHMQLLLAAGRRFMSVMDIVVAVEEAKMVGSYVSREEREKVIRWLESDECTLFNSAGNGGTAASPAVSTALNTSFPPTSLLHAGLLFDAAYHACNHSSSIFLAFCHRYAAVNATFPSTSSLCQHISSGLRPAITLPPVVFHSILTFLHLPAIQSLFTTPQPLSTLSADSLDLTALLLEGGGLEGTQAALLLFVSLQRSFASLAEVWAAVHIHWRVGLATTFEMRKALFAHLTQQCSGLLTGQQQPGHSELEWLLVRGGGLHRSKAHCTRLHALGRSFDTVELMAAALITTLTATDEEVSEVRAFMRSADKLLDASQADAILSGMSMTDYALLLHETGGAVPALLAHLAGFARSHRCFTSFIELLSSLQLTIVSQSYSPPFALFSLLSFLLSAPGLFTSAIPIQSLTGRHLDAIISTHSINSLLTHLSHFHTLQRTFPSLSDLCAAIVVAFRDGLHTSADMRRTLQSYLSSTECCLFESVESDSGLDAVLDVMIEVSGTLPLCFHHLQQLRALQLRFTSVVKAVPVIKQATTSGVYSTRSAINALLAYLSSPECTLLTLSASASLSSLPATALDQLLLTGGGLLNTLKHLQRLNAAQRDLPSFTHLIACLRTARRRRLYYSSAQRHRLYDYITSPACRFFDGLSVSVRVSEREMERLFKYGAGVDNTMRVLNELNAAHKRFKSFVHVLAIVKKIGMYDTRLRQHELDKQRVRRDVSSSDRQDVIAYLSSAECHLFSEHQQALRVTAVEVDELIATATDATAALNALRQLNEQGRIFLEMADLTAAVSAMIGPQGLISLSKSQRVALLSALSYPTTSVFSACASITLTSSDLHALVYAAGSVDDVIRHVRAFDDVGRCFASYVDFRAALVSSVQSGLHAREDERALLSEMLMAGGHGLFGDKRREVLTGDAREMESIIRAGHGFLSALYYCQYCDETLQRFDSLASLTAHIATLTSTHPLPPAFAHMAVSSMNDRYHLFTLLSSSSSQLFLDASDEADMLITPLAFDVFFSRCGGVGRAVRVVLGLERMERRYMSFGEMVWSVCKVTDGGVGLREIEEYEVGSEEEDDNVEDEDAEDDSVEREEVKGDNEEEGSLSDSDTKEDSTALATERKKAPITVRG